MNPSRARLGSGFVFAIIGAASGVIAADGVAPVPVPSEADAITTIDLTTTAGSQQMQAEWRYHDAHFVPARFVTAGSDGQPGSRPVRTQVLQPRAGTADFDDSAWPVITPDSLNHRRGPGRSSFAWYRVGLTIPETINGVAARGRTLVFQTTVDDYAEVWVDGELPRMAGQSGGSMIAGWNAPNRLVIGRNVVPGQKIRLAVLAANGPISAAPTNYLYLHDARLSVHAADRPLPQAVPPQEVNVEVVRKSAALNRVLPVNLKLFKLAEGFQFTEGPVYVDGGAMGTDTGHLLFSDPNANRIYRYSEADGLSVFREESGYSGPDIAAYRQPGSNGLTLDRDGRLVVDQHGNRQVVRVEADGGLTVLADRDGNLRLNSPNDLVYKSDGALYFTDPPFGLPKAFDDPGRALAYSGIYRVDSNGVRLLSKALKGPNGLAFSPDEKFLYVGNWDETRKIVMRYPVKPDGTLGSGTVFADLTKARGDDAIDGIKVDIDGHVYVSGPGGLWIFAASGEHLGTVQLPRHPHNMAFGDADSRTLYICAQDRVYRMRVLVAGIRPMARKVRP